MKKIALTLCLVLQVISLWGAPAAAPSFELENKGKPVKLGPLNQKDMTMEKSLIILKPDCMEKQLAGKVINRFTEAGFRLVGCKMMRLDEDLLKVHYAHLADKPFFPEIAEFMSSHPVMILILEGESAIDRIRDLLGPTDSTIAPKGTIRGDWGTTKMLNIAHASDSQESANEEIARFFVVGEVF